MIRALVVALAAATFLSACQNPSRNTYRYDEVGKSSAVSFGTVLALREIDIIGRNTGLGAAAGAGIGAGAGSYAGSGSGSAWAVGAGLLAGAVAGAVAEQAAANRKGLEYTVMLETGVTLTVAQESPASEPAIPVGSRVMVQNTGGYQRVIAADNLPTEMKRPQGIKLVD